MELNSQFLSAKELMNYHIRLDKTLPRVGQKEYLPPVGDMGIDSSTSSTLEEKQRLLSEPRVIQRSFLSQAEWDSDAHRAVLTKIQGKFINHMGYYSNQKALLYPEEALFLMETSNLEVTLSGVPLSIQEGYSLMLKDGDDIDKYHVYSHLSRMGYIVVRHNDNSGNENPARVGEMNNNLENKREDRRRSNSLESCDRSDSESECLESLDRDACVSDSDMSLKMPDEGQEQVNASTSFNPVETIDASNSSTCSSESKTIKKKITIIDLTEESIGPVVQEEVIEEVEKEIIDLTNEDEAMATSDHLSHSSDRTLSADVPCNMSTSKEDEPDILCVLDTRPERAVGRFSGIVLPNLANSKTIELYRPPSHLLPKNVEPSQEVYHFDVHQLLNMNDSWWDRQERWPKKRTKWESPSAYDSRKHRGSHYMSDRHMPWRKASILRHPDRYGGPFSRSSRYQENRDADRRQCGNVSECNSWVTDPPFLPHENNNRYHSSHSGHNEPHRWQDWRKEQPSWDAQKQFFDSTPSQYYGHSNVNWNSYRDQQWSHSYQNVQFYGNRDNSTTYCAQTNWNITRTRPSPSFSCSTAYPSHSYNNNGSLQNNFPSTNNKERISIVPQNEFFSPIPSSSSFPASPSFDSNMCYRPNEQNWTELRWKHSVERVARFLNNAEDTGRSRDFAAFASSSSSGSRELSNGNRSNVESTTGFERRCSRWDRKDRTSGEKDPNYHSLVPKIDTPACGWKAYKDKLRKNNLFKDLPDTISGVLWKGDVKPLLEYSKELSSGEILSQLSIIKHVSSMEISESREATDEAAKTQVDFYVYLPNSSYKKKSPPPPNYRLKIVRAKDKVPSADSLRSTDSEVPLLFAAVDSGEISFFTLNNVSIPIELPRF